MKKFFKITGKFAFNCALVGIMLLSAQKGMNLPICWVSVGYITIFGITLGIWHNFNK